MDILKSINHRMNSLKEMHDQLKNKNIHSKERTLRLNNDITLTLTQLKLESKTLLEECKHIHNIVFKIGIQLRQKVSLRELNAFQTQIDDWPLEEFINQKELEPTFKRYAP